MEKANYSIILIGGSSLGGSYRDLSCPHSPETNRCTCKRKRMSGASEEDTWTLEFVQLLLETFSHG